MAKPKKPLPTDIVELKNLLRKTRAREALLEAELLVREHPEMEVGIFSVMIKKVEVEKAARQLSMLKPSLGDSVIRVGNLTRQIQFTKAKLGALQDSLNDLLGNTVARKVINKQNAKDAAMLSLKEEFDEWEDAFIDMDLQLENIIPGLAKMLHIS